VSLINSLRILSRIQTGNWVGIFWATAPGGSGPPHSRGL